MEKEKSFFNRFSSYFSKDEEQKSVEKLTEEGSRFWENFKNYTASTYETSVGFVSEKGTAIYGTTSENLLSIKQKVGGFYEQIELKNYLYEAFSKIDIISLKESLNSLSIENPKGKNAVMAVVTFLSIFEKHQVSKFASENSKAIIAEKQKISNEISSFLNSIDFKEVLEIALPYIMLIPHPAAPILYKILCFLCKIKI